MPFPSDHFDFIRATRLGFHIPEGSTVGDSSALDNRKSPKPRYARAIFFFRSVPAHREFVDY